MKKRILIIRNDHIGDLVLSTAVFREIKKKIPNSEITLIVNKGNKTLVEKNKNIDEFLELPMAKYNLESIKEYFKMSKKIKEMQFDVGIDLRGSIMNSFFLLKLAGIKKRISRIDHHPIIRFFLSNSIKIKKETHATEDNLKIINEGLGIYTKDKTLEIITTPKDDEEVKNFLNSKSLKEYICICPLASLPEKQWPTENWKKIIKHLEKFEKKILIIGMRNEEEKLNWIKDENKNCEIILDFNLRKMSLLFKGANLVMTQDGGPMHIAWASRAKLIELHNPFLYGMNKVIPLGKNSHIIYTKNIEMKTIKVEDVEKKIGEILR